MIDVDPLRLGGGMFEIPVGLVPESATDLAVVPCDKAHAVQLVRKWHSRLPNTQDGPWSLAFRAAYDGVTYGVALWLNPSARTLPDNWLELRRLAIPDDAPHCTASRMLGQMRRWIQRNRPDIVHLISYQDSAVHTGTIYKAAGWTPEHETQPRRRDRSTLRPSGRRYRWNINGDDVDAAPKIRWGIDT